MKWRVPDQDVDKKDLERGVHKDYQAREMNREDAMDHSRLRKLIEDECLQPSALASDVANLS